MGQVISERHLHGKQLKKIKKKAAYDETSSDDKLEDIQAADMMCTLSEAAADGHTLG